MYDVCENTTISINEDGKLNEYELTKKPIYEFFKRLTDIVCSALALTVLSPLFLVVAVMVKSDGGPAFFVQPRAGKNGKYFNMYKFRSMCVDAEEKLAELKEQNEADGLAFKMEHDPRVTRIGDFIRRTSIDELPQLLNILKGEMSIVGPRPALEREVTYYNSYQMQRLLVKPGLTCIWQCSGRSDVGFDEWMDMDIRYIKNRGYFYDWLLILKTVPAVLKSRGAK